MENEKKIPDIIIEGAQFSFTNFQGKVSDWNKSGERNFGLLLPDDIAEKAKADGWNVKYRAPREDDPTQYMQPWIKVKVNFRNRRHAPKVEMLSKRGRTILDEELIGQLDWADIEHADIAITPYEYPSINGAAPGISAYLKELKVVIKEGYFDDKYADYPYNG